MSTLYRARVVRLDSEGVFVEIPVLGEGGEWGPLELVPIPLAEGDPVLVGSINEISEDLALLGKLVTTNPAPPSIPPFPPANSNYVLFYENAAARDAAITSPTSGQTTWLDDEQRLETYTDEPTAGWTQSYHFKSGVQTLPAAAKIGMGITPTAALESASAASTDAFLRASQTGDTQKRLTVNHAGLFEWSSGTAVADVTMHRASSAVGIQVSPRLAVGGTPATNVSFTARQSTDRVGFFSNNTEAAVTHALAHFYAQEAGNATSKLIASHVSTETAPRFASDMTGKLEWGTGGSAADTNLYRNAADELKTDDNFTVAGNLAVTGNVSVTGNMPDGVSRWVSGQALTATTGAIGATTTVVMSTASFTWKAGHIYRAVICGMCTASATPNRPLFRLQKTDEAGTELFSRSILCNVNNSQHNAEHSGYFKVGGSDVTAVVALTLQGSGAFNTTALDGMQLNIYDEGLAASRPTNIQNETVAI